MGVKSLDHYNLLTTRFSETLAFYGEALGMEARAPMSMGDMSNGAWIHDESGAPLVHVQRVDPHNPEQRLGQVRARLGALADGIDAQRLSGAGAIEHIAFECDDYEGLRERLSKLGLELAFNDAPQVKLRQIFVRDPNGVLLELNFRS
jgi:catechol 2,3-dioxygenase-like lactoylglutathione lyase family enzyme